MSADLFAGIPVSSLPAAVEWYSALLGSPPSFFPNDVEAVWEVTSHGYLYVELIPDKAGHAMHTLFVPDYEDRLASIADRGLRPSSSETYENGVRKAIFTDPDGNEIGFGGGPAA